MKTTVTRQIATLLKNKVHAYLYEIEKGKVTVKYYSYIKSKCIEITEWDESMSAVLEEAKDICEARGLALWSY